MSKEVNTILHGDGFVVLEDFFDPAPLLAIAEEAVAGLIKADGQVFSGGYRPDVLMEPEVQDLMLDPRLLDIAWRLLGTKPAFGSLGCNSVPPGSLGMEPHFDYPYFAMPKSGLPESSFPALCVQMVWYLTDVTEDGGPTLVVPGSQLVPEAPTPDYHRLRQPVLAKAGSLFLGHGALWHGVGVNRTQRIRHAMLGSFVPFWVHPMIRPSYGFGHNDMMRELARSDFQNRIGEGYSATTEGTHATPVLADEADDIDEAAWTSFARVMGDVSGTTASAIVKAEELLRTLDGEDDE
jgi:hypothetical protein